MTSVYAETQAAGDAVDPGDSIYQAALRTPQRQSLNDSQEDGQETLPERGAGYKVSR